MRKMRKEQYGDEQIAFVVSLVKDGKSARQATRQMCKHFGLECDEIVERSYRKRLEVLNLSKASPSLEETEEFKQAKKRKFNDSKQRFIVTWAQAETPIHKQFLENIEAYAKFIDADIHVIAGRYKNPTSLSSSKKQEAEEKNKQHFWDKRVVPYLDANRQNIHPHLSILGDVKIQPTASTPLTGLNGMSALESCIIGHPSVQLKSLPVLDGYPSKLLLTTGAVTLKNYTDTKAGKRGEFHHSLGFVIVELDGDVFHLRQVQCSPTGSFFDLIYRVKKGKVYEYTDHCPALVLGDLHLGEEDEEVVEVSMQMAKIFKAQKVILHDVFSGYSISHHELRDPFTLARREQDGSWELQKEIDYMVNWFKARPEHKFVSIMSNHVNFIDRWVRSNDWRKMPNKAKYLELSHIVAQGLAPKGIIPYILDKEVDNVESTGYNDSYRIADWELGLHGDFGTNGSRGSVVQFKNLNTKTVVGHSHTPARDMGCLSVGTNTKMRLGYNQGLSSWLASNVIIYPNGKASHINIVKGKFTTLI